VNNDSTLFSLQGFLRVGVLNADGSIGALRWLGNCPEATLELDSSATDKTESYSGKRLQVGRLTTGTNAKLTYTLDEWSSANAALAFQAAVADITASTVTGEVFPADLVAGDLVRLDHPFASSLVITDSTGAPITVATTDYALEGHGQNIVRIIDPTGYVQPFKAAYSYAAAKNTVLFSAPGKQVFVQFDGINTETNEPIIVDLWRVRHDPVKSLGLIHKEYGSLAMSAAVLYDVTRADDPTLGGFGRVMQKAA
jgi:hypothetical protein